MNTTFLENVEVKKDIKISYDQYPVKVTCLVTIENKGDNVISNIKYSDKTNYDDTGINVSKITVDRGDTDVIEVNGKFILQCTFEEILPGESKDIQYYFIVSCLSKGGVYSLNSFIRVSMNDQTKSMYTTSSVCFEEFETQLTCITRCKGAGGFNVVVKSDSNTLEEKIRLKGYMNIPDNISLKITCIRGFYARDNNTGNPINTDDIVTNTIVAFYRTVKLQKCTNNSFSVFFRVNDLSEIGDEKIISFLLLTPELKSNSRSILLNPPLSMLESITVNPRLKCCGECFEKQS